MKVKRFAFKACLRCMGGDLSAVVASTSRRPRASKCLVKVGSRPVQIATPAFQPTTGLSWFRPRSSGVLSSILGKSSDTWLSPHKALRPHNKPSLVDFTLSAFNDKRHSSSCQSKFVKKTTFNNSLSLDLTKSGLETFVFFLRQILRTPRFCLRTKSLRSLCKISSSKSQKTPACNAPRSPQGKNDRLRYRSAEWTVSTPWPARFQLRWHLRLRLGNVSTLPFLSACT